MKVDADNAIAQAICTSKALWEQSGAATEDGLLSRATASSMTHSATEAAIALQEAVEVFGPRLLPAQFKCARECIIDLETLASLAALVMTHDLKPATTIYLAHAIRCTAEKSVNNLMRAAWVLP
ncbi:hypothetical protein DVT68_14820 [Dyella solisilvae]|uniref:Uncharacterized protein n=1 Tax=Dyella solisilvae TaxID=1920168 RepID=A0A370K558_9GAMM|nr:hypothetical protein [Dyella solisilvae]RDI97567.1 hypothetical protein DVT68_14820 [Dyella solisilvae]